MTDETQPAPDAAPQPAPVSQAVSMGQPLPPEDLQVLPVAPAPEAPTLVQEAETEVQSAVEEFDKVRDCVERWIVDHLHNSPVSRDTDALNYLRAQVKTLVEAIKAL